jgi:hypothetical protein
MDNPEKTEGAIKNGQSRDSGNIGNKTQNEVEQGKKTQHRKLKR